MADAPSRGGVTGSYLTSPYQVTYSWSDPRAPQPKQLAGSDWFGPLLPMRPTAPEEVASRQWDFQSGYNLNTTPRVNYATTFETLRAIADGYDLLRLVIETRKDQTKRLAWDVRAKDRHTKKNVDDQIKRVTAFFKRPDGIHTWSEWLGMLLEDLFVIDAPTLYKHRNRAGKLIGLLPLDGATIKPVIDNFGRTPVPYKKGRGMIYPVAYQQILKGFPAVNYSVRDLLYKPRNVRVTTPYGFSPTEQVIATVNIALRRQTFTTDYFSKGSIPDSIIGVPENWTPDNISAFQNYWDSYFEGDASRRRKAKFVPGGVAKTFIQTKEPDLKGDFDDWLSRIVCFAFSISPQALVKQVNRATAQTDKARAEEEGLVPIMSWIKELVDQIVTDELDAPDVEFVFSSEDSVDEATLADILDGQVKAGIKSLNEARVQCGLDPIDEPAFNTPMVLTAMGYQPVDANTLDGIKAHMDAVGAPPQTQPGASNGVKNQAQAATTAPKGTQGKPASTKPVALTGPKATTRG